MTTAIATHVVTVCHKGLSSNHGDGNSNHHRQLFLFEGISANEVSTVLGALFRIPGHKRVVGLAGTVSDNDDVLIPLLAACRYPHLIFAQREAGSGGIVGGGERIFRTVTKDADHPEELLFPVSALTPPPPNGSSDLRTPKREGVDATSGGAARACRFLFEDGGCRLDGLVSAGWLSPQDGLVISVMIKEEDPVIFAAFRVAAASAAEARGPGVYSAGKIGGENAGGARSRGRGAGGGFWTAEAVREKLVCMLDAVLEDRRRRMNFSSRHGDRDREGDWGGGIRGGNFGFDKVDADRIGGAFSPPSSLDEVPLAFQSDAIALADVALVSGKISKQDYVQALYAIVTLDPSVVQAYRADVRQLLLHPYTTGSSSPAPRATLQALGASLEPTIRGASATVDTRLPPYAPAHYEQASAKTQRSTMPYEPRFPESYDEEVHEETGNADASPEGDGEVGGGGGSPEDDGDDVCGDESALRDSFLRRALALIAEGRNGLSAREKAFVEEAIAAEHPWVEAIYDECKETGDVRGLMQNLQRLPALLERDQASSSSVAPPSNADIDRSQQQPPIPGGDDDWEPPISLLQQLQHHHSPPMFQPPPSAPLPPPTASAPADLQRRNSRTSVKRIDRGLRRQSDESSIRGRSAPNLGCGSGTIAPAAASPAERFTSAVAARRNQPDGNDRNGADPSDAAVASATVIEQLSRVIAGCAHLLRLRSAVGEEEEQTLRAMSDRGSPVLLAAVEAYGANQDLEDLLDTLATAAEIEISLNSKSGEKDLSNDIGKSGRGVIAKNNNDNDNNNNNSRSSNRPPALSSKRAMGATSAKAKYMEENPSPYYINLPRQHYQQRQQQQQRQRQQHDARTIVPEFSTLPAEEEREDRGETKTNRRDSFASEEFTEVTPATAAGTSVNGESHVDTTRGRSNNNGCLKPDFNGSVVDLVGNEDEKEEAEQTDLQPQKVENGQNQSRPISSDDTQAGENLVTSSSDEGTNGVVGGDETAVRDSAGDGNGVSPVDENATSAALSYPETVGGTESSSRKTAAGARAQELVAAKFAGMKSAAAAKVASDGKSSASSSDRGTANAEPSGDKRLRQDVSQLVSVMAKHGMLTDRQRLFLLAQVGRRITAQARERHDEYVETGDSRALYQVLMTLSTTRSGEDAEGENDESTVDDDVAAVTVEELDDSKESEESRERHETEEVGEPEEPEESEESEESGYPQESEERSGLQAGQNGETGYEAEKTEESKELKERPGSLEDSCDVVISEDVVGAACGDERGRGQRKEEELSHAEMGTDGEVSNGDSVDEKNGGCSDAEDGQQLENGEVHDYVLSKSASGVEEARPGAPVI